MRGFDRDLIRGGHYGQRSCEPRKQAEHMAAPTNAAGVKKVLANPEPSTHGPGPFATYCTVAQSRLLTVSASQCRAAESTQCEKRSIRRSAPGLKLGFVPRWLSN